MLNERVSKINYIHIYSYIREFVFNGTSFEKFHRLDFII